MENRRSSHLFVACLVLVFGALATSSVVGQEECSAYVTASLDTQEVDGEVTRLQFVVEVESGSSCAHVEYVLVIEELTADGETKKVRKPRTVKLNDGNLEEHVRHEMSSAVTLQGYDSEVVKCVPCEVMP